MAIWSSEKLKSFVEQDSLFSPFDASRIKHGAYELGLGNEVFLTSDTDGTKDFIDDEAQISIPPGHFGILITEEEISIPLNVFAFISIKAKKKFEGLVNVSGFHVDPGFSGKLKFSVFNAGGQSIVLQRREPLFLIWFSDLDCKTEDGYDGSHKNQKGISSDDVRNIAADLSSPALLLDRIKALEIHVALWTTIGKTIFGGMIMLGISLFLKSLIQNQSQQQAKNIDLPQYSVSELKISTSEEFEDFMQHSKILNWNSPD